MGKGEWGRTTFFNMSVACGHTLLAHVALSDRGDHPSDRLSDRCIYCSDRSDRMKRLLLLLLYFVVATVATTNTVVARAVTRVVTMVARGHAHKYHLRRPRRGIFGPLSVPFLNIFCSETSFLETNKLAGETGVQISMFFYQPASL